MLDAERKRQINELNRQLTNLNKYECNCGTQENGDHYWACAIKMAEEIKKELLAAKMKLEICLK